MKKIKIGDILEIQPKSKVKAGEGITNGKYPFYTCSNELTKSVNTADYEGDALIMGTGGMASIHYEKGKFSTSTDCLVYKSNKNVNLSLINKYLRTNIYLLENGFKGAGLRHISRDYISNITIPLPERNLQDKIVKELDLIEKTITNHNDVLKKYDTLIKSRFIEMFGDPATNPKKWEIKTLDEVCKKITDGKHGGCKLEDNSDYYYVGAREIFDLNIHYETAQEITKEDFEKDYKRCNLEIGDFCIVNTGATIGKTAIAKDVRTTKTLLQKSVALLKTKENLLSALYLQYSYITNPSMYKVENASAQPNLLLSKIRETKIMLPPLFLQNNFAAFVQQIDKSKFAVQKSLEKAEILYKSLMQQYFA